MSKMEELAAQAAVANQEAEKQNVILRQLENELEQNAETLDSRSYSDLKAKVELAEMRAASAFARAREKQAALDEARTAEAAKLQREAAQRAYDSKLAELNTTRAQIATKRQAIRDLQNELPTLASRQNILLMEIDKVRSALQQSA